MPDPLISIVEEDDGIRHSLADLARSVGYRTETFRTAEAFLSSPSLHATRLVITGAQLPGISGIELKSNLDHRGYGLPVIMIAAFDETELHEQAHRSGAFCLLIKPFKAAEFVNCLERALPIDATNI